MVFKGLGSIGEVVANRLTEHLHLVDIFHFSRDTL